jgi:hypothetical protein
VGSLVSTLSNDGHREQFRDKEEIIQQAKDFMEEYFKSEKRYHILLVWSNGC